MVSRHLGQILSRRGFLQGLAVLLASWQIPLTGALAAKRPKKDTMPVTDFSGFVTKNVKGFIDTTEEAIQKIKLGEIVHPRGTGHSSMGQGLRENAWLFTPPHHAPSFDESSETIKLAAISSLREADEFLGKYNYILPVSPDHRSLSIGGVLSVGGYGVESVRYGALVNYVTALDILLPNGQTHLGVPVHLDICQKILEGLGQHGVILSAYIKCTKKPKGYYIRRKICWSYTDYIYSMEALNPNPKDRPPLDLAFTFWYKGPQRPQGIGMISTGYFSDKYENLKEAKLIDRYHYSSDIRADREKAIHDFNFNRQTKYYVWSDHGIAYPDYILQAEDTGRVIDDIISLGGEVALYSCPVNLTHFNPPKPGAPDYVISLGIYSNFKEDQLEEAKKASQMHLDHSRRNLERGGVAYKHAWHVTLD